MVFRLFDVGDERHATAIAVIGLTAAIFVADLFLPLGVAGGVPYVGVILVALRSPSRRFVVSAAVLCSGLTLLDILFSVGPGNTEWWKVIVNRCLALFAIWVTTVLGLQRNHAAELQQWQLNELGHLGRIKTAECLAAALAHELNQPLTAVALRAEVAQQQLTVCGGDTDLHDSLREIAEQSHRASGIVRALRNFVRTSISERSVVELSMIINDAFHLAQPTAREYQIDLQSRLEPLLPPVCVDSIQIEQVLLNLIQNAIDSLNASSQTQRTVCVTTRRFSESEVAVEVQDNGPGMTAERARTLFEPLQTSKANGLGLGLAISRSMIEAHGGRLWLQEVAEPRDIGSMLVGATFLFTLPIASSAAD